jgi:cation-transporting ATPase E
VQTIASRAGVPGADEAVDARTLPEGDALVSKMEEMSVFGRVTPDQKRSMVAALQAGGHTVAMTGDGVNDVLALKKADLGVAMGTGTAAARAVAQIVLVDSRFETLPSVLAEGRRVTANIERVANMFATKTVWAAILALAVALVGLPYPMLPRQLTLVDTASIGIPAFFLALAPNPRRYLPGFVGRVARFVLPTGAIAAAVVFASYLVVRHLGASVAEARAMETAIFALIGLRVVSIIERPLRGWRLGLVIAMAALVALAYVVPFSRDFFALGLGDWRELVVTAVMGAVAWFVLGLGWRGGERAWPVPGKAPPWVKSIRRRLPRG